MRLGSQTGSLVNHLASAAVRGQPEPVVGMGATVLYWSDRHACTIVEVGTIGKAVKVVVQRDRATRTDKLGMTDSGQQYSYAPDPQGARQTFRQGKDGRWHEVHWNRDTKRWNGRAERGNGLQIGVRREHYDFSF